MQGLKEKRKIKKAKVSELFGREKNPPTERKMPRWGVKSRILTFKV